MEPRVNRTPIATEELEPLCGASSVHCPSRGGRRLPLPAARSPRRAQLWGGSAARRPQAEHGRGWAAPPPSRPWSITKGSLVACCCLFVSGCDRYLIAVRLADDDMVPQLTGQAHVRYGHACRPRLLEVACPRCSALAIASKPSEKDAVLVGDLSPSWRVDDWTLACQTCPYRAGDLSYQALPPRYWSFEVGDMTIWGWNREHLDFVRRCLLQQAQDSDPYAWLGNYIPGDWKAYPLRVANEIAKRLASGPPR